MKYQSIKLFLLGWGLVLSGTGLAQNPSYDFPEVSGPYLGQTAPGLTPELFAPGLVSTGLAERDLAVSPDGNAIYWGLFMGDMGTFIECRRVNHRWQEPEVISFGRDADHTVFEPCLSPDGRQLWFLSTLPTEGEQDYRGWGNQNIFFSERQDDGSWSAPQDPGSAINTADAEYFPSMTTAGVLYFTRNARRTRDTEIFRTCQIDGQWQPAERLPDALNEDKALYNCSIAPDESYLLACVGARGQYQDNGRSQYYVFFRKADDTWSEGVRLFTDSPFSEVNAVSINVSPDGRYIFFAAGLKTALAGRERLTLQEIQSLAHQPQNGQNDIYWVSTDILKNFRPAGW